MKKIKKYVPYMLITLVSVLVFFREFGNCDELWNFSFARNIVNGLLPYKDYSIVQTPLSAYITAFFLLVFGDKLLSYRIAGYVLCVTIFCLFYYVCKTKSHSNLIASIATVFVMGLQMIPYIYNYNYLSAAIVLIIFAAYCKAKNHDTVAFNLLIGLLIGITPLIKQNTGLFFLLANFTICVTEFFFLGKKKINVIVKFVASISPMLIFSLIFFINGTANDFYEFAIDGIRTFSHRITPVDLAADAPISFVLLLIFASLMVASVVSMIRHNRFRQDYHFLFLSLASLSVVYPLCDSAHVLCAFITITPFIVSFIKPRKYKDVDKYICCFVSFVVAAVSIVGVFPAGSEYIFSDVETYSGIITTRNMDRIIKNVDDYIIASEKEGYMVRIADDSAAEYMLPINEYEKNWSMLLIGNIGNSSVEDLLCEPKKCRYLVFKNTDLLSMQNHFELIEYIKNNYQCIGEIESFDVYEKNESN